MSATVIRAARPGEARSVLGIVRALAADEKLEHEVTASEATIDAAPFGARPRAFRDPIEEGGCSIGTPRRSTSIGRRARGRWTNGR